MTTPRYDIELDSARDDADDSANEPFALRQGDRSGKNGQPWGGDGHDAGERPPPSAALSKTHNAYKTPGGRSNAARTPHTAATSTTTRSTAIAAIVESRAFGGEIGMAIMDLRRPELHLSQFADNATYVRVVAKLEIYQPVEILMPSTAFESGKMSKLYQLLSERFPGTNIVTVQRKYFNETKGLAYIRQLALKECSTLELELSTKYYCCATAAALLKYVEYIQNTIFAPNSLKVVFRGSENTMMIDATTAAHLELVVNSRNPKASETLFGTMNYTKTAIGARMLRSNILQPPNDVDTINTRLDAVEELMAHEDLFFGLKELLAKFVDIDHLITLMIVMPKQETVKTAESAITNVIVLKHLVELVPTLCHTLRDCTSPLLSAYRETLASDPRFAKLKELIATAISDDTHFQKGVLHMRAQKCFAVKPGINGLLDVARRTYTETIEDIYELVGQYAAKYELPLKPGFSSARGFFITMPSGDKAPELPGIFTQIVVSKRTVSFTTGDLIKYNDRVQESLQEIYLMTGVVVKELLGAIRDNIGCLYKLSESVAMIDMIHAFVHKCTISASYVRPEFTGTLAVQAGRHPILERIDPDAVVPNDAYASDACNFQIITGPNMSGKSTFLKQVALLQIMAQMGSFVPATYASFRLADHLFSRIGSDDDMETNASTFVLEMRETAYIVQNVNENSLVIMDELGRGTNSAEGVGICLAVCESLIATKAFTFFATHFRELTELDTVYPNVENFHLELQRTAVNGDAAAANAARPQRESIVFTHTLSKGKTLEESYGIRMAELAGFPASVIEEAESIAARLSARQRRLFADDPMSAKRRAVFQLAMRLIQAARVSQLPDDQLRDYLRDLRAQYKDDIVC